MANIEGAIGKFDGEAIVAGKFNAKCAEWGAEYSDIRRNDVGTSGIYSRHYVGHCTDSKYDRKPDGN